MTPSNIVGTVLIVLGALILILWGVGEAGAFEARSSAVTYILIAVASLGLGGMLRRGKGDKIGEAIMWWFKRGKTPQEGDDAP